MSQVKAIFARASNAVMGQKNTLPWDVPADMRRFKRLTSGCIVVMGYNTWASLGCKPLPNRRNVVIISSDKTVSGTASSGDVMFATSLDAAMSTLMGDSRTVWVIGGPALIAQAMGDYDAEVHRTTLDLSPEGDVSSAQPDRYLCNDYVRAGYEEFVCDKSGVRVVFERFVKAGIDAGTK